METWNVRFDFSVSLKLLEDMKAVDCFFPFKSNS